MLQFAKSACTSVRAKSCKLQKREKINLEKRSLKSVQMIRERSLKFIQMLDDRRTYFGDRRTGR